MFNPVMLLLMQYYHFTFSAMGSPCALHFYHNDNAKAQKLYQQLVAEVQRLEQKYSRYLPGSLLSQINQAAGHHKIDIDNETYSLLAYTEQAYQISEQLFDITTGVLRHVWDFKQAKIPQKTVLEQTLNLVDWSTVQWNEKEIYLPQKGMEIDFGGIVKEYTADSLARILLTHQVNHALVDLGGDIHVVGPKPNGEPWLVGIKDPSASTSALIDSSADLAIAHIPMTSGGLASSGDYERHFVVDGKNYSHILNPKTGWPALGLSAVSVWCEQCVMAGTIATVAMLKQQAGIEWLTELSIPFIAVDNQGEIYNSEKNDM